MFFTKTKTRPLGKGVSGTVELVEKGADCYVVKTYHSRETYENKKEYRQRVLHEYNVLSSLDHPHIIKALSYRVSLDGNTIKLLLEAGTVNLLQVAKKVGPAKAGRPLRWWLQTCRGVQYMHRQGFCHRDLKLENLVLGQDGHVKIIDMATAFECGGPAHECPAVGVVGSARYLAPETASCISYRGKSADVWSLGIILCFLATGQFPWSQAVHTDADFAAFATAVEAAEGGPGRGEGGVSLGPVFELLPPKCVAVVHRMLQVDPGKRSDVEGVLADPWVEELGSGSSGM